MDKRPSERELLQQDIVAFGTLIQERPELLEPLADTTDLGRQSFHMVLADLVWQAWYHVMAGSLLLEHELEPSLFVIERAAFEALVGIGYLTLHPQRHDEAVIFLAYTHLRDKKDFAHQAAIVADRATVLARMPSEAVAEASRRLTNRPWSWSGKSIKQMAAEGKVTGYDTLYAFLSGAAHAGVAGNYVKVFDGLDGKRTVKTGTDISPLNAESHANFLRRSLHAALRVLVNTLPGPAVEFPSWDPGSWVPDIPAT